ncbi:MAG: hypothetical protein ACOCUF_01625 [Patescibacteria group bacterium]
MIEFLIKMGIPEAYAGDVWLVILFLLLGLALVFTVNKKNLGALVLSIYVAYTILSFAYFIPNSGGWKAALFILLGWFCYINLRKTFSFSLRGKKLIVFLQMLLLSLLAVGMTGSLILEWFSPKELEDFFTSFSHKFLISEKARFIWVALPFVFMILFKKSRR